MSVITPINGIHVKINVSEMAFVFIRLQIIINYIYLIYLNTRHNENNTNKFSNIVTSLYLLSKFFLLNIIFIKF